MRLPSDATLAGSLLMSYGAYFTPNMAPLRGHSSPSHLGAKASSFKVPAPGAAGSFVPELLAGGHTSTRVVSTAPTMTSLGPLGRWANKLRGRGAAADPSSSSGSSSYQTAGHSLEQVQSVVETDGKFAVEMGGGQRETWGVPSDAGTDAQPSAVAKPDTRKKVMILMSDTGGGHRASAKALEDALEELYPGQIKCEIVDMWTDHSVWPYNQVVPFYRMLQNHPKLWRFFWYYGIFPLTTWMQAVATRRTCFTPFKAAILACDPDLVVSVHPLCQDIPLRVLKSMGEGEGQRRVRNVPFATVVTDLGGAHPLWFHKGADLCFVPSDACRKIALRKGLSPGQLRQHGLPLRRGFWHPDARAKDSVRASLGLAQGRRTTLVVGGGDGIGGITGVADALGAALGACTTCGEGGNSLPQQLVVVCGNNKKVKAALEAKAAAQFWGKGVEVVVKGFVGNMEDYMTAADCIVTKAGPGTIAEAMCRSLPTMLSCYLPGQEAGNIPFVVDGGFGAYSKQPKEIAATVAKWMSDDELLEQMSAAAGAAGRPSATYDIARDLGGLLYRDQPARNLKGVADTPVAYANYGAQPRLATGGADV